MVQNSTRQCPVCNKESCVERQPFCSKRCAEIDLARWLNGAYFVPSRPEEDAID